MSWSALGEVHLDGLPVGSSGEGTLTKFPKVDQFAGGALLASRLDGAGVVEDEIGDESHRWLARQPSVTTFSFVGDLCGVFPEERRGGPAVEAVGSLVDLGHGSPVFATDAHKEVFFGDLLGGRVAVAPPSSRHDVPHRASVMASAASAFAGSRR